jgi:hypothetical protein
VNFAASDSLVTTNGQNKALKRMFYYQTAGAYLSSAQQKAETNPKTKISPTAL